jgi:pimeloyl-ACP methyl ester carboxylesterase
MLRTKPLAPQLVPVGDVGFAYRRFGRLGGLPLLFLNYFAANMDDWDPKVPNGFAAERDVILFDNAGVGSQMVKRRRRVAGRLLISP